MSSFSPPYFRRLISISLVSFVFLYLEAVFLRLIGTEVRIFAYMANMLLLIMFIAVGIGMLVRKPVSLLISMIGILLLTFLVYAGAFAGITDAVSPLSESVIWHAASGTSVISLMGGLFGIGCIILLLFMVFVPIGQYLGSVLGKSGDVILPYATNILWSVLGMVSAYGISYAGISPYVSLLFPQLILTILICSSLRKYGVGIVLGFALGVTVITIKDTAIWSPYQKLSVTQEYYNDVMPPQTTLNVNGVGFMGLLDLSKDQFEEALQALRRKGVVSILELEFENMYDIPFIIRPDAEDVLVIGAGGGNDVAAAVRAGVPRIDAVEIDPKVLALGRKYHPEEPYNHSSVNAVVGDGRAFIRQARKSYDVVIMGFVDSHTMNSSVANVQLDNYLYTENSFQEVRSILKQDGILFLSFGVYHPWVGEHLKSSLTAAFGDVPVIFDQENYLSGGGTVMISSLNSETLRRQIDAVPNLRDFIDEMAVSFPGDEKLTDDWPYLYLDGRKIPSINVIIVGVMAMFLFGWGLRVHVFSRISWVSFLFGAAFLLYEFWSIAVLSLVIGNTWITNIYCIAAILVWSITATFMYRYVKINLNYIFTILIVVLVGVSRLDWSVFDGLPDAWRGVVVSMVQTGPLFFSGYAFISIFSSAKDRRGVLASNLFGAFVGGAVSLVSYIWGLHSAYIIVIVFYVTAWYVNMRNKFS